MHTDGLVRVLYQSDIDISGVKVSVYECSKPPTDEYGEHDAHALFVQTFHTNNANKNVFYEAYKSGSKKPFYKSKTPPTKEELNFQIVNSGFGIDIEYIIWGVIAAALLYVFI